MSQVEKTEEKEKGEIEESSNDSRSVGTRVPEVEIHVFRCGKGPIEVLKSKLVGYEQDQLDVRDILDKYSFKSIFAFNPNPNPAGSCGRGLAIRFNSRNGRSILTYRDGATIYIDGEPKDSLVQPVTKILIGVAVITILIALVLKETPAWIEKFNIFGLPGPTSDQDLDWGSSYNHFNSIGFEGNSGMD
nr:hypothetical protein CFP56_16069 [Quercus suber]